MCMCFPADRPTQVKAKGTTGKKYNQLLMMADNPHPFKVPLDKACCAEPLCCCAGTACAFFPFPSCYLRKQTLDKYGNGIRDFKCCQGYLGTICCVTPADCCPGSEVGLCLEAICCPVLSVSVARIYVMEAKRLRPDPIDYQIIQCSNCLQMAACVCHVLALFLPEMRDAAAILDCIADTFTAMVNGCMCAQIIHEMKDGGGRVAPAAREMNMMSAPQPHMMEHHPQPYAQPAVAMPMGMAQPSVFPVIIPPGAPPGSSITVQAPNGQTMMVQVPPGMPPGSQMMVQY